MIGRPNAHRAVGSAMNKNPFAPTVPCHRVVKSNGELGGFAVIIMLSALTFSISLTRSNEFIISRASGLSALRSLLSVLISAFF